MLSNIEPSKVQLDHIGAHWEWQVCGCDEPALTLFALRVNVGWFAMDMFIGGRTE